MLMVGWRQAFRPQAGVVPDPIAVLLAQALCASSQLSFPVSSATLGDLGPNGSSVRVIKPGSLIERAEAVLAKEPLNINIVSTYLPDTAVRLFEDFGYPWEGQGQVALLTPFDHVPKIDRKTLRDLLKGAWGGTVDALRAQGVQAVVRPGAGGEIAGVLSLSDQFTATFIPALEREALRAEMEWQVLVERDFATRMGKPSRRFASA